jgi:hypothetical protein
MITLRWPTGRVLTLSQIMALVHGQWVPFDGADSGDALVAYDDAASVWRWISNRGFGTANTRAEAMREAEEI